MSYFFMINSSDCKNIHSFNMPTDFITELPQELELSGDWDCALTEIGFINCLDFLDTIQEIYIFCDICEDVFVRNQQLPILRRIQFFEKKESFNFSVPYYIKVIRNRIKRIRIYITDENFQIISFSSGYSFCTLHLKRRN